MCDSGYLEKIIVVGNGSLQPDCIPPEPKELCTSLPASFAAYAGATRGSADASKHLVAFRLTKCFCERAEASPLPIHAADIALGAVHKHATQMGSAKILASPINVTMHARYLSETDETDGAVTGWAAERLMRVSVHCNACPCARDGVSQAVSQALTSALPDLCPSPTVEVLGVSDLGEQALVSAWAVLPGGGCATTQFKAAAGCRAALATGDSCETETPCCKAIAVTETIKGVETIKAVEADNNADKDTETEGTPSLSVSAWSGVSPTLCMEVARELAREGIVKGAAGEGWWNDAPELGAHLSLSTPDGAEDGVLLVSDAEIGIECGPVEGEACACTLKQRTLEGRFNAVSPTRFYAYTAIAFAAWVLLYNVVLPFSELVAYDWLGLEEEGLGGMIQFFLYDSPKVSLLLLLVSAGVGILRTYLTRARMTKLLGGNRGGWAGRVLLHILAAALGVVTPFCSCSAVPLFIGMVTAGVPMPVTMTFLSCAPVVGEVSLVLLAGSDAFGVKVAVAYAVAGMILSVIAGLVLGLLPLDSYVEDWVRDQTATSDEKQYPVFSQRLAYALSDSLTILKKVWPFILVGIGAGAVIHGFIPEDFIVQILGADAWYSVPIAIVVGIPLYSNAAGVVPIMEALIYKGAALGTTLAFQMSVIGLSFPEAVLLRKVVKPKLIALFFGCIFVGQIVLGYSFNAIF
ncbi:predicted permease DUF318 [Kipferlia bialata]|uniref:Predicted permease DUF318 n=1 Tax=Kipferlia bialata TaxID=797122 RepID=A0A9K3GFJ0_9EUKA|nr:predicted permease DUF318 [Kipferlia bialata]|eukprot:g1905.t1